MFCNSCGNNIGNNEAFCNKCGASNPMYNNVNQNYPNNQMNVNKDSKKNSTLSIWAIILSIIGCTSFIGIILAIIDLSNKDGKKKICSICALIISSVFIIISIFLFAIIINSDSDNTENYTSYELYEESEQEIIEIEKNEEIEESEVNEEIEIIEETKEPENQKIEEIEGDQAISKSDYIKDCLEYKYKTIARNPDDCTGNKYYGTFEVFSKENGSWYSGYDICYKCFDEENNFIYVIDMQNKDSEDYVNVLEGDTIVVYGTFNGMVESKNYLNNSVSDEVCLDMYFCDLIEE